MNCVPNTHVLIGYWIVIYVLCMRIASIKSAEAPILKLKSHFQYL